MTKSGFISLTGRPNVGKSTLMNQILGEKIAITSKKPQTTRNRIQGVYTEGETQIVFIDTPGIHHAEHRLGEYMNEAATRTIGDVDYVLLLVECGNPKNADIEVINRLKKRKAPTILVINKIDECGKDDVLKCISMFQSLYEFEDIVPVSALTE